MDREYSYYPVSTVRENKDRKWKDLQPTEDERDCRDLVSFGL